MSAFILSSSACIKTRFIHMSHEVHNGCSVLTCYWISTVTRCWLKWSTSYMMFTAPVKFKLILSHDTSRHFCLYFTQQSDLYFAAWSVSHIVKHLRVRILQLAHKLLNWMTGRPLSRLITFWRESFSSRFRKSVPLHRITTLFCLATTHASNALW